MSANVVPPGFDPAFYRWWDRLTITSHCARGFNFHHMGLQGGQHNIGKQSARAVPEPDAKRRDFAVRQDRSLPPEPPRAA